MFCSVFEKKNHAFEILRCNEENNYSRMMKKRHSGFNFIYEFICAISFSSFNFCWIYLYPQLACLVLFDISPIYMFFSNLFPQIY